MRVLRARGVKIHPHGGRAWEICCKLLLDLLRSYAEVFQVRLPAVRAYTWDACRTAAIMAFHHAFKLMVSHRNVAVRAFHHIAAAAAGNKCGITAPVHKQDRLLPCFEALAEGAVQWGAENAVVSGKEFAA